jgi:hypothetical protein
MDRIRDSRLTIEATDCDLRECIQPEIVDVTSICRSLPDAPNPEILRDQVIATIDGFFDVDGSVVVIEGSSDIGKTTFLSQFSRKHGQHTISLFIRRANRWSYDYNLCLQDLCNQSYWILKGTELQDNMKADEALLGNLFLQLRKLARKSRQPFIFVIDGIDEIPEIESKTRESILQVLPWGFDAFKFVLSGNLNNLRNAIPSGISAKLLTLFPFSLEETQSFLSDAKISTEQVKELHRLFRGHPGQLVSARRILLKGTDAEDIIQNLSEKLSQLFDMEWQASLVSENEAELLLALLSFDRRPHDIESVSRVLGIERSKSESLVKRFSFLEIDRQNNALEFVSDAFRSYVISKLIHRRSDVYDLIIKDLIVSDSRSETIRILPDYLKEAGRYDELIEYLSPELLAELVSESQSLLPVRRKAELGIEAAIAQQRDSDLLRFGLGESSLREMANNITWISEVQAYAEAGDFHRAMALAQSAPTKEECLRLLAAVARIQKEKGMSADLDIEEQVKALAQQIDIEGLGETAIDIASDIICVFPETAIDIVEKASSRQSEVESLDWAFARMSMEASATRDARITDTDSIQMLRSRIRDPYVRQFSTSAHLLLGDCTAAEVISEISSIEKTADKLMLARIWLQENRKKTDAEELLSHAISLLIKTTDYSPNAAVYRDLAFPLPFIASEKNRKAMILTFENQARTVEPLGPTEDYVELMLLLAEAENEIDKDLARNRLIETYLYISQLTDLSTKAACVAKYLAYITSMDPEHEYEDVDQLHSLAAEDLKKFVENLLKQTADHYAVCRGIIKALAPDLPFHALEIALQLNTERRRDKAFGLLVRRMIAEKAEKMNFDVMWQAVDSIKDPDYRDHTVFSALSKLYNLDLSASKFVPIINKFAEYVDKIRDPEERSYAAAHLLSTISIGSESRFHALQERLKSILDIALESVNSSWRRIDMMFTVSKLIARFNVDNAKQYLVKAVKLRKENWCATQTIAQTYVSCVKLALRAFCGLVPAHLYTDEDIDHISNLVNRIPSDNIQATMWAHFICRLHAFGGHEEAARLCSERLNPLIQMIPKSEVYARETLIANCAPALYISHRNTALVSIAELSYGMRHIALEAIVHFVLTKALPMEPYEYVSRDGYNISYEACIDLCELAEKAELDSLIYFIVQSLGDTLDAANNKNKFSKQQRAAIIEQVDKIIATKLPDIKNIKHNGFVIAAKAQRERIAKSEYHTWEKLEKDAHSIDNTADRAYVFTIIASCMPSKHQKKRNQLVEESQKLIASIPADVDRVDRSYLIASLLSDFDTNLAKKSLKTAMDYVLINTGPEMISKQRRVIDLAYKISPEWAASIASCADDDPARAFMVQQAKDRLNVLKAKENLLDMDQNGPANKKSRTARYAEAAWLALGSLVAGKRSTSHFQETRQLVEMAAKESITKTYPLYAYAIENAVRRYAGTPDAKKILRPLFETSIIASEFAARLGDRSATNIDEIVSSAAGMSESTNLVVGPGDRDKALRFIREWAEKSVSEYLKICDPYFLPTDLEILKILMDCGIDCDVSILCSTRHQLKEKIAIPLEDTYRTHWRMHVCEQPPPVTDIVMLGTRDAGHFPLHDRWLITKGAGLRLGTSFNSLGHGKESEISLMGRREHTEVEQRLDVYLRHECKTYKGERLLYSRFTLG